MTRIYEDITETIGNTPLVKIRKIIRSQATVLAKLEGFNPMCSVKDRIALKMIEQAGCGVPIRMAIIWEAWRAQKEKDGFK